MIEVSSATGVALEGEDIAHRSLFRFVASTAAHVGSDCLAGRVLDSVMHRRSIFNGSTSVNFPTWGQCG